MVNSNFQRDALAFVCFVRWWEQGGDRWRGTYHGQTNEQIVTTELPENALQNKASKSSTNYSFINYEASLHENKTWITLHMQKGSNMQQVELSARRPLPTNWFLIGKIKINELEIIAD